MSVIFGTKYRDSITHFEGIATGRAEYMTGCEQILLEPLATDGKKGESVWFDIDRLEGVSEPGVSRRGGPQTDAPVR